MFYGEPVYGVGHALLNKPIIFTLAGKSLPCFSRKLIWYKLCQLKKLATACVNYHLPKRYT